MTKCRHRLRELPPDRRRMERVRCGYSCRGCLCATPCERTSAQQSSSRLLLLSTKTFRSQPVHCDRNRPPRRRVPRPTMLVEVHRRHEPEVLSTVHSAFPCHLPPKTTIVPLAPIRSCVTGSRSTGSQLRKNGVARRFGGRLPSGRARGGWRAGVCVERRKHVSRPS